MVLLSVLKPDLVGMTTMVGMATAARSRGNEDLPADLLHGNVAGTTVDGETSMVVALEGLPLGTTTVATALHREPLEVRRPGSSSKRHLADTTTVVTLARAMATPTDIPNLGWARPPGLVHLQA